MVCADRFCHAAKLPPRDSNAVPMLTTSWRLETAFLTELVDDNCSTTDSSWASEAVRRPRRVVRVDGGTVQNIWKPVSRIDLRFGCLRHYRPGVRETCLAPELAELRERNARQAYRVTNGQGSHRQ